MTRLARYQLYACPSCGTVYKHPLWGSFSVHFPRTIASNLDRVCVKCGFQAPLEGWAEQGTVEKLTHEEQERRSAALLFSLGLGPKPISEKRKLPQRIREFWLGSPEPVDPSEQYPLIKIANEVD